MGKNRIALILISAGLLSGGALLTQANFNKPIKNNINNVRLLTDTNNASYGCVINGNGDLSISNSRGEIVGYISVGQMLKLGSNNGKSTFVTVEETGVTGYINNSNIKDITSGISDQVVRMNRKGTVINVSTDVHLRADATMNSGIVANLTNGTNLTITGKQGNWYRVSINGIKGYIFEEYIGEGNSSNGGIVTVGNGTTYTAPSNGNRVVVINNKVVQNGNHTTPVQHHDSNVTPKENNNEPIHVGGKVENPNPQVTPGNVTIPHTTLVEHHDTKAVPNDNHNTTPVQPDHITHVHTSPVPTSHTEPGHITHVHTSPVPTGHVEQKTTPVQPEHHTTPTVHHDVVKPTKPVEHHIAPVVLPAPVITANNATINVNHSFNNSMIDAQATVNGQPVQTTITGNVNTKVPGTYDLTITATNSQGKSSSKVVKVTVDDVAPTLVANNYTMQVGQNFNVKDLNITATSAEGQNLAGQVKVVSGSVNTNKPGVYTLTLSVTDNYGETSTTTIKVTVKASTLSISNLQPIVIYAGQSIPMNKFDGTANQPDCTYKIIGNYNTNEVGTYNVELQATDSYGTTATTPLEIIVKEVPMAAPTVTAQNVTITQGQSFSNSMLNASANESNCNITYSGNVNTNEPGVYKVTVTATNSQGEAGSIEVTVTVKAKPQQQGFQWVNKAEGIGTYSGPIQEPGKTITVNNAEVYVTSSAIAQQITNQYLFNDINQFREANGLKPFAWNGDLYTMAHWKTNDCMTHNYYTHKDLQGQYTYQVFQNQYNFGTWCENLSGLAAGVEVSNGVTCMTKGQLDAVAEQVFQGWKASPGHRANMLSSNTLGAVSVILGTDPTSDTLSGIATMEAASESTTTKTTFNIHTLQSVNKTVDVPMPAHFTNPGPNVFVAKEGSNAKHETNADNISAKHEATSKKDEVANKSKVQTLNNSTKINAKNQNNSQLN